jgi:hypothetical protein
MYKNLYGSQPKDGFMKKSKHVAQLDNITHGTTISAHRPPSFTASDKQLAGFFFPPPIGNTGFNLHALTVMSFFLHRQGFLGIEKIV